jgi:methionyl-tRNA formyltransferase
MKTRIVFMGTPDFAVPALKEIIDRYDVSAVFTQPDKPKGRGQKLQYSPVKEAALANNIPVFQPSRLRNDEESYTVLKEINPEFIVVIAYGQILPLNILELPAMGCINVHASLLPLLRGAAPINWSIINGYKKTGITTMLMGEGLDTGDMLLKAETEIGDNETAGQLHDRLSLLSVDLLVGTIEGIKNNSIIPEKQKDELSCYAPMLNKELGHIDWNKNSFEIHCLIRGVTSWPGAYCYYNDNMIKIIKADRSMSKQIHSVCGEILKVSKQGIEIACREGSIIITELQEFGGKRMDAASYINGHNIIIGDIMV